jgi:hypothetical protein
LIRKVTAHVDLDLADLTSSKRNRKVSNARAVISYLAVNQLGCSASEVARKLGISGMAVSKGVDRGNWIFHIRYGQQAPSRLLVIQLLLLV